MKKFFQLELRSSIKTKKRKEIITHTRGSSPPKYLSLYAKVFLVISTIYSTAFVIQGSFLMNWDKFYELGSFLMNWDKISYFLPEDRSRVRVCLLFFFFSPGVIVSTK